MHSDAKFIYSKVCISCSGTTERDDARKCMHRHYSQNGNDRYDGALHSGECCLASVWTDQGMEQEKVSLHKAAAKTTRSSKDFALIDDAIGRWTRRRMVLGRFGDPMGREGMAK